MKGYQFIDSSAIPWRKSSFATGVDVKDLGGANGQSMQLVRFAPGTEFPLHTHLGPEFIFLIEGEAFQESHRLQPGWASVADAETVDENFKSPPAGCVFLTVYTD